MIWQPRDTAPRDGEPFIGWWCGQLRTAIWNLEQQNWQEYPDGDFECVAGEELTHWMRPEPPP